MPTVTIQKRRSINAFWLFGLINGLRGSVHEEAWEGARNEVKTWFNETAKDLRKTITAFPATISLTLPSFVAADSDHHSDHHSNHHSAILAKFKSDIALGKIPADTSFVDYFVDECDNGVKDWC
jgi:hypothetical protein